MIASPAFEGVRAPVRPGMPEPAWFVNSLRKRTLDTSLAMVALVLSAPILLVVALAVRLSSRGDIIFRQERVGLAGRPFTVLKFRTMVQDVDDSSHRAYVQSMIQTPDSVVPLNGIFKLANDPRITTIGHVLRKTGLDELPQIFNVLRGEMSIVGPRPALAYEVELYQKWQLDRLKVKPGITGFWQVSGRNRLSYIEMCRLDIQYIEDWALRRDLAIVARTPLALIRQGSAA